MLKLTMDAKELKTMMEKAITVIDKKASLVELRRLYLQVETDGTIKTLGTNFEHYVEIRNNNAYNTDAGLVGIDIEGCKSHRKIEW